MLSQARDRLLFIHQQDSGLPGLGWTLTAMTANPWTVLVNLPQALTQTPSAAKGLDTRPSREISGESLAPSLVELACGA